MKYQIGDLVTCSIYSRHFFGVSKKIVLDFETQDLSHSQFLGFRSFPIIGTYKDGGSIYLISVPEDFLNHPVNYYPWFNLGDDILPNQPAWMVEEACIFKKAESLANANYGGKCKKCGDYNPYAEVDGQQLFICYRCKS